MLLLNDVFTKDLRFYSWFEVNPAGPSGPPGREESAPGLILFLFLFLSILLTAWASSLPFQRGPALSAFLCFQRGEHLLLKVVHLPPGLLELQFQRVQLGLEVDITPQ